MTERAKQPTSIEVRLKLKAQNRILAELVDRFGSIKAAAEEVGVCHTTFSQWLNFRSQFASRHYASKHREKTSQIILQLERLTERSVEDIFPGLSKDELAFLGETHVRDLTMQPQALTQEVADQLTYEEPQECHFELRGRIDEVLKTLSYRERQVIKLRYGLGDGETHTLEEVGHIFKVTGERIRQTEAKAVRKLQQPSRSQHLAGFLD